MRQRLKPFLKPRRFLFPKPQPFNIDLEHVLFFPHSFLFGTCNETSACAIETRATSDADQESRCRQESASTVTRSFGGCGRSDPLRIAGTRIRGYGMWS